MKTPMLNFWYGFLIVSAKIHNFVLKSWISVKISEIPSFVIYPCFPISSQIKGKKRKTGGGGGGEGRGGGGSSWCQVNKSSASDGLKFGEALAINMVLKPDKFVCSNLGEGGIFVLLFPIRVIFFSRLACVYVGVVSTSVWLNRGRLSSEGGFK